MRKAAGTVWALFLCCMFVLSGCSRTIDDIIAKEPSVKGVVTAVYENSFLMLGQGSEGASCEYDVSLSAERKDSYTSVSVGDEVVVYYNGDIAESAPPRIGTVYAIILRTPADRADAAQTS